MNSFVGGIAILSFMQELYPVLLYNDNSYMLLVLS